MSADSFIAFYGVRFEVGPDDIDGLEKRSDPRMISATKAGLKHYWGNFASPDDRYLLFIGTPLAILGAENASETSFTADEFDDIARSTDSKLKVAGFADTPRVYLQFEPDA